MSGSNPWDAEWEVSEVLAKHLVYSQFPQLSQESVRLFGHGWDNTVYLVGDRYVFRFPRRSIAVPLLETEGKLLPMLADRITIPYSKPLFYGAGTSEYPPPFLGYDYLPGTYPIGLTDGQRLSSARTLAKFLKELHAFPVLTARENGAPSDHRNLTDLASRKEKMVRHLADLKGYIRGEDYRLISDYLQQLTTDRVEPKEVFLHGDLHFKNMLVDEKGRISGIIDWGDINIGHPACDLNVAYSFLPPAARTSFFQVYGGIDGETKLLARLIAVFIPMMILHQAVTDRDEAIADEAINNIRRALAD
ncbi:MULTISPECIES: phosphotransferase [Paenibacillus]|uniref:Aminoglycoside phosphotransferase n=1 Tax=Paenibacillus albilobatus TaxID=2716884 RepID=A0A920CAJ3_9BACL|nr:MULTISPECIES: phosphotransferase [Paenibacillus]GIO30958.1 aminoglycoside phosphotransferase [Paenibacillus albilobatus]